MTMAPYNELYLRCSTLATAADIKGPLGQDILAKLIIDKGVGHVMQGRTDEGHYVRLHGPITLRLPAPEAPAVPAPEPPPQPEPQPPKPKAAPKRRGRPPGSKNKPKPPKTVPVEEVAASPAQPSDPPTTAAAKAPATASAPAAAPEPTASVEPASGPSGVRMTPAQERALRHMQRQDRYMELLTRNTHEL